MSFLSDLSNGINSPCPGEFIFKSSDHIRYQNGQDVSGHNYGCNRSIKIENNINGGIGYTITIFNEDSIHPLWGNNIQMAPKQMQVVNVDGATITLRGYGYDALGFPFSNYALSVIFRGDVIESCTLHMIDRGVDIIYLK